MSSVGCARDPSPEEAASLLNSLADSRSWAVLIGECWVEYEGRGASRSTPGRRLIIIKPSHSVIVHGPKNFRPENWQPDGSSITATVEGGLLVVRATRRRPRETLIITCSRIYSIQYADQGETGTFIMYLSEHEIRDALARNPSLVEEGLRIVEHERPVPSGFVDLYAIDREGRPVVIEIKRVKAGEAAVKQLARYLEALARKGVNARGILVAPGFTDKALYEASRRGIKTVTIDLNMLRRMIGSGGRGRSLLDYL